MDFKIQDSRFHQIKFPNSRFQKQTFCGFRNLDSLTWGKVMFIIGTQRSLTLGFRGYFFLIDIDVCRVNEAPREKKSPSWEPYQTVSTVYFILRILRTDFWSQGNVASQYISHVIRDTGIYIGLALYVDLSMLWKKFLLHDRRCKWTCLWKQWVSVFVSMFLSLMALFSYGCWRTIRILYYFVYEFNNDLQITSMK